MKKLKRFLKIIIGAILLIGIIGLLCYRNVTPLDALTGATHQASGLQEGGALTCLETGR